jgi:hypothetical protein
MAGKEQDAVDLLQQMICRNPALETTEGRPAWL